MIFPTRENNSQKVCFTVRLVNMSAFWLTIREFITSKKFMVAVVGVIVATAGKHGLQLDPDTVNNVVLIVVAYIGGQALADWGKEAAKVNGTVKIATTEMDQSTLEPERVVKDKLI